MTCAHPIPSPQYPVPNTPHPAVVSFPEAQSRREIGRGNRPRPQHRLAMIMLSHSTVRIQVARLLVLAALPVGAGACSSTSEPTEPVVFNLVAIGTNALPAPIFGTGVQDEMGGVVVQMTVVLRSLLTLTPDGTWQWDRDTQVRLEDGTPLEDPQDFILFGTYRWSGDTLLALREGPPDPPNSISTGCCSVGETFVFEPVDGRKTLVWQGWKFEAVGGTP